jgi:hypothetical protein
VKWILWTLATLPILAQSTETPEPAAPPPSLIFKLSGLADSTHGQDWRGRFTWQASDAFNMFISGDRSGLASTTEAPSPSGNNTITTSTSLGGSYVFGRFELGLQYDHSTMSDLLASHRIYVLPAFELGSWRLGLECSSRTTDFDRLQFKGRTINTPTGPVTVSGYADLNVKDTGLGATLEYDGEVWRPYMAYSHYSYGSFEGSTDVTRIRNASGTVSPEVFKALSGRLVAVLERQSTSRLNSRAALLDSTTTLGLEANLKRSRWTLEGNRDVDHLTTLVSNTYTATGGWKATPRFTVELQAGATTSDTFGTNRFAGLTIILRTRPSS